jgi:hypothetical protein
MQEHIIYSVRLPKRTIEPLRGRIISSSTFERSTDMSTLAKLPLLGNSVSLATGQDNVDSAENLLRVGVIEWSTSDSTTRKEKLSRLGSCHFLDPRTFVLQDLLLNARTRTMIAVMMASMATIVLLLGRNLPTRAPVTTHREFALQTAVPTQCRLPV